MVKKWKGGTGGQEQSLPKVIECLICNQWDHVTDSEFFGKPMMGSRVIHDLQLVLVTSLAASVWTNCKHSEAD